MGLDCGPVYKLPYQYKGWLVIGLLNPLALILKAKHLALLLSQCSDHWMIDECKFQSYLLALGWETALGLLLHQCLKSCRIITLLFYLVWAIILSRQEIRPSPADMSIWITIAFLSLTCVNYSSRLKDINPHTIWM